MSQKNFELLARLLVQTWGLRATERARFLAGTNPGRVRLVTQVARVMKEVHVS
jgi:hypothetical protein